MAHIPYQELDIIRQETGLLVPRYNIKKLDPVKALESGDGNCFAKAAVGSGLIMLKHDVEPQVGYSTRLHATPKSSALGISHSKNFAHITVLTAAEAAGEEERVQSLCFGIAGKEGKKVTEDDPGDIIDFNETETLAEVDEAGEIYPSDLAAERGYCIIGWREGVQQYLEALDRDPVDFDLFLETLQAKYDELVQFQE